MAKIKKAPLILIVDDLASNRYFISKILSDSGYEVIEAKNGIQSLAKL